MSNDSILPPVPTTTSIVAPDPFPPDKGIFLYGLGGATVTKFIPVDIPVEVYPLPGFVIVTDVTIPAVTNAEIAAPTPIVEPVSYTHLTLPTKA